MENKDFEFVITKEHVKERLIDAYKSKSWSQINKLIVLFGGELIEEQKILPPPPPPNHDSLYLG